MRDKKYFVHESSYVDDNVEIGEETKIWHFSHIQEHCKIGKNCSFGQNVNVSSYVSIGNGVKVQNNVSIYEGVEIEDDVFCGPSVVFTNDMNPRAKYPKSNACYKKTLIKQGATLGANSTIVCGYIIGKWAFVAAGSVIVSDVKDYARMVGVPARQAGWICECGEKLDNTLECHKCGRNYIERETGLTER
ncbi:acyltransferase [Phascolarctobacterium faecium]|uniref:acyltransferase n=1 Tax=Phascolarctobacterium faecium TaxID=33025 RepID=UPI00267467DE|nr:acyltransferase [Phascolarctobacterium faecium]